MGPGPTLPWSSYPGPTLPWSSYPSPPTLVLPYPGPPTLVRLPWSSYPGPLTLVRVCQQQQVLQDLHQGAGLPVLLHGAQPHHQPPEALRQVRPAPHPGGPGGPGGSGGSRGSGGPGGVRMRVRMMRMRGGGLHLADDATRGSTTCLQPRGMVIKTHHHNNNNNNNSNTNNDINYK